MVKLEICLFMFLGNLFNTKVWNYNNYTSWTEPSLPSFMVNNFDGKPLEIGDLLFKLKRIWYLILKLIIKSSDLEKKNVYFVQMHNPWQ